MTILDGRLTATRVDSAIRLAEKRAAHNYSPLPIVAASAQGRGSPMSTAAATWIVCPPIPR